MPFREAHEISGACVRLCDARGIELWDLTDDDLAGVSHHLTPDVRSVLSLQGALGARSAYGGTAPSRVVEQLERARDRVADDAAWALVPSR